MSGIINLVLINKKGVHCSTFDSDSLEELLVNNEFFLMKDNYLLSVMQAKNSKHSLIPANNGLIVVDCIENEILSYQDSFEINKISIGILQHMFNSLNFLNQESTSYVNSSIDQGRIYDLFMSGRIVGNNKELLKIKKHFDQSVMSIYQQYIDLLPPKRSRIMSDWDSFLNLLKMKDQGFMSLRVDFSPFDIINFYSDNISESLVLFKDKIFSKNIKLSDEELLEWDNFIRKEEFRKYSE